MRFEWQSWKRSGQDFENSSDALPALEAAVANTSAQAAGTGWLSAVDLAMARNLNGLRDGSEKVVQGLRAGLKAEGGELTVTGEAYQRVEEHNTDIADDAGDPP